MLFQKFFIKYTEKGIIGLLFVFFLLVLFISSGILIEGHILLKWYTLFGGSIVGGIALLVAKREINLTVSSFHFFLFGLLGYLLLCNGLAESQSAITVLSLVCFIILFLLFRNLSASVLQSIPYLIAGVCMLQAGHGLLQKSGLLYVPGGFPLVGSYDNPAGIAACLAVGFPFCLGLMNSSRPGKILGIVSGITILAAIFFSGSRAGVFSVAIVAGSWLLAKKVRLLRNRPVGYILLAPCLVVLLAVLVCIKKDSARGRLLIWENSISMIKDQPFFGHGAGSFHAKYMVYQAAYFETNPQSRYVPLADNVAHPFNEFLLLVIEYGMIGLVLLAIVVGWVIISRPVYSPELLSLIALAVFAIFSYPLRYPFTVLLLAYGLSQLTFRGNTNRIKTIKIGNLSRPLAFAGCLVFLFYGLKDACFEYQWGKLVFQNYFMTEQEVLIRYQELYQHNNGNPLFLYNYGAVLNQKNESAQSNAVLQHCVKYWNDYDVQILLAENHARLGQDQKAVDHYKRASRMCPNRFLPLFRMVEILDRHGDVRSADRLARIILEKPVKIPSAYIEYIRSEMKKRLEI